MIDLNTASMKDLVALYNSLSDKPTTRFPDRKTAIRRITPLLPVEVEKTPWGKLKGNKFHRLHNDPTKKGAVWEKVLDVLPDCCDDDGVFDLDELKSYFPGVHVSISAGWVRMLSKLGYIEREGKKAWVLA